MRRSTARFALALGTLAAVACVPPPTEPTPLERCLAERAALVDAIAAAEAAGPPAIWADFYVGDTPKFFSVLAPNALRVNTGDVPVADCPSI